MAWQSALNRMLLSLFFDFGKQSGQKFGFFPRFSVTEKVENWNLTNSLIKN
jgi:hypothetical protein